MNITDKNMTNNEGQLMGEIVSAPKKSHISFNEGFYELMLKIPRLSGNFDQIPVSIGERMIENLDDLALGKTIGVTGEFRSFNKIVDNKSKLILYFFAKNFLSQEEMNAIDPRNSNLLKLEGFVCKPPVLRETPFGRRVCDLLVAVNRKAYNRSDYIPCIAWGRNANFARQCQVGTPIAIEGRIQSREYVKKLDETNSVNLTAYEVSCSSIAMVERNLNQNNSEVDNYQLESV